MIRLAAKTLQEEIRMQAATLEKRHDEVDTKKIRNSIPVSNPSAGGNASELALIAEGLEDLRVLEEFQASLSKLMAYCSGSKKREFRIAQPLQASIPIVQLLRTGTPTMKPARVSVLSIENVIERRLSPFRVSGVDGIARPTYLQDLRKSPVYPLYLQPHPALTDVSGGPLLRFRWCVDLMIRVPNLFFYVMAVGMVTLLFLRLFQFSSDLEEQRFTVVHVTGYPANHPAALSDTPLDHIPPFCKGLGVTRFNIQYAVIANIILPSLLFFLVLHKMHKQLIIWSLSSLDAWIIICNTLRWSVVASLRNLECSYDPTRDVAVPGGSEERPGPTTDSIVGMVALIYLSLILGFVCGCVDAILMSSKIRCLTMLIILLAALNAWWRTLQDEGYWELETRCFGGAQLHSLITRVWPAGFSGFGTLRRPSPSSWARSSYS